MGISKLVVGTGLVVLFSFALIIFMLEIIAVNNPTSTVLTNPYISNVSSSLNDSITNLNQVSNDTENLLNADAQPSPIYLFLIIYSAFAIPKSFLNFIISGLKSLSTFVFNGIFGSGSNPFYIVIGIVNAILLIIVVLAIIRAIRTGEDR